MNAVEELPRALWPEQGYTRVPYRLYWDPEIYRLEQQRLFQGATWNFLALEVEIPEPGDFKLTQVGDLPVVVSRDQDGSLHAFVNQCAHRGAAICRTLQGNALTHTCIYHQWRYDARGELIGIPFQRGIGGVGGFPADFDPATRSLRRLRVASYRGLVFGTFDRDLEPLETWLGDSMRPFLDRIFDRPLRFIGTVRQVIHGNWKLYCENVSRDTYHVHMLHLFASTFLGYRPPKRNEESNVINLMDAAGRHHITATKLGGTAASGDEYGEEADAAQVRTYRKQFALEDASLLAFRPEIDDGLLASIQVFFHTCVVERMMHALAIRHIVPKGPDHMELVFLNFGYADDDEPLAHQRHKHHNFFGPGGLVSMEDGEAIEIIQASIDRSDDSRDALVEMGGRGIAATDHVLTETGIRGFYRHYMELMGFRPGHPLR